MTEDIKVKIGADVSAVEKAISAVVMRKRSFAGISSAHQPKSPFRGQGAFTKTFERADATLSELKNKIPTSSSYQSQRGGGAVDASGGLGGRKTLSDAFKIGFGAVSKKNKMELWWKWLKGTYNLMAKYSPLLKTFADIFSAAMSIIMTALLLPFLGDIIGVLKFILLKAVDFYKWMKDNKDAVRSTTQIGIEALMAGLGLSGLVKVFGWLAEKALSLLPGFKLLEKALAPVVEWLAENGILGALKGVVAWVAKFVDPLLWITLIGDIGKYIFGWIQGWSDNPTWKAFWGGMSELAGVVAQVTDVFGWLVSIATGGVGDKVKKITDGLDSFDKTFRGALGMNGSTGSALTEGGGVTSQNNPISIAVSGLVDEQKFRAIIKEEISKAKQRLTNSRGSVGI